MAMNFRKIANAINCELDMTPMIDVTFQLLIFFMLVLNFGEGEQDQRIRLPSSALAKPPDAPTIIPLTIQLTKENTVLFGGDEMTIEALTRPLQLEVRMIKDVRKQSPADATVFIRADVEAKTGVVQELIQKCQDNGFERFALRAKHERE